MVTHPSGESGDESGAGVVGHDAMPGDAVGAGCLYAVYDPVPAVMPAGPPLGPGGLPFEAAESTIAAQRSPAGAGHNARTASGTSATTAGSNRATWRM